MTGRGALSSLPVLVCFVCSMAMTGAEPRTIEAIAVGPGAIQIDGDLSDRIWASAPASGDFVQREPTEGVSPSHPTDVRVAFDESNLWVAVRAGEPEADKVRALLTRRDDSSPSDWIHVFIDSQHDRRTAFEFAVNPAGVKLDAYWFNDNNSDRGWDAVWDVAVARSPEAWTAEFRIPLSQLRFNPNASGTFGFAVAREIAHMNETDTWPLLARSASGFVSSFGDLSGLVLNGPRKKLELMPYAVTQSATSPVEAGNPLTKSPDPGAAIGMDVKYQVGAGLTLTGTMNPDFGQVEADPAVVNLNGFETFFAERRPFFVEGSGNFNFDLDCNDGNCTGLFYSRRIGRTPHRAVEAPEDGYVTQPVNSTIIGAAKLTGRLGKFSIGALNAVTREEHARLATGADLVQSSTPVEPSTNYSIVRLNREFTNHSRLGFMVTSTNRALPAELEPIVPRGATTGGVDSDWRLGSRFSLKTHWAGSAIAGSEAAIADLQQNYVHAFARPDAGHVTFDPTRTRLDGHAGGVSFEKIAGRKTRMMSNISYKTPGFDTNDLGYLQRADDIFLVNWVQLIRETPTTRVRTFRINFNEWTSWNFDGDRRVIGGNINAHWVFTNNWSSGAGFNMGSREFDDRLTRGGPGGYVPGSVSQWGYVQTDDRKPVFLATFWNWSRNTHEGHGWSVSPEVAFRPSPGLEARVGIDAGVDRNDAHWVENLTDGPVPHYVFGRLAQTTVGISMRFNYTISPRLSVQLYSQPFVSSGAYTNFRELVNGRAAQYDDRYAPFAYTDNPDFNYHSFRTTNVMRWEYRPGSALFVVWQQGREDTTSQGTFRFDRDFGRAFTTPGTNIFLVKISRWLNF
jgi:hypothetical protein